VSQAQRAGNTPTRSSLPVGA